MNPGLTKFNFARFMITGMVLAIIAIASLFIGGTTNFYAGILLFLFLVFLFIGQGTREIPADPPTKAIPMMFGKLVNGLLEAGWYFFPLRSKLFFTFVLVSGQEIPLRVPVEIRTPDNHDIRIPFFAYFKADLKNPIQFLIAGGEQQVEAKLQEQVEEVLREWITSPTKGPQTWRQARQATEETVNIILESFFEKNFRKVSEEVPTEILFKYFEGRMSPEEKKKWGKKIKAFSDDEKKQLARAIDKRREEIEKVKLGKTEYPLEYPTLGICITRIGLSNIEPFGKTAEGVNQVALATLNKESVAQDAENFREEVDKLKGVLGDAKEARKAASVRRGMTKEEIKENQFSLDPNMVDAAKGLGNLLIERLVPKKEGV